MNREEIQTQCLELPEAERAALAQRLADSLGDARRIQALRDHLEALEKAKMEALRQKLGAEMATWFKGPSVEMTPEAWKAFMEEARDGDRLDEPYGEGVPVEWTGRTRREHRELIKRPRP